MSELELINIIIDSLSLIMGFVVVAITYITYIKTSEKSLLNLSIGFAMIASGSILEDILFRFTRWDIRINHLIESIFVIIGFYIILKALQGGNSKFRKGEINIVA